MQSGDESLTAQGLVEDVSEDTHGVFMRYRSKWDWELDRIHECKASAKYTKWRTRVGEILDPKLQQDLLFNLELIAM